MANTRKQPYEDFFGTMGLPMPGLGAAPTGGPTILTPADTMEDEETTDPYAGFIDPSLLAGMYPPPVEESPAEEEVVPQGVLPAYAQAMKGPLPDQIAQGGSLFEDFASTYGAGGPEVLTPDGEEDASDPSKILSGLMDKQFERDDMGGEAKPLPGYSFLPQKKTAQQMRGASFLLPMSDSERRLSDAGYRRPAERGQWLRSLRVKKGYF